MLGQKSLSMAAGTRPRSRWGQTIADATHLQLAGGDLMEQAQIIMLLGNLSIDSMTVR